MSNMTKTISKHYNTKKAALEDIEYVMRSIGVYGYFSKNQYTEFVKWAIANAHNYVFENEIDWVEAYYDWSE